MAHRSADGLNRATYQQREHRPRLSAVIDHQSTCRQRPTDIRSTSAITRSSSDDDLCSLPLRFNTSSATLLLLTSSIQEGRFQSSLFRLAGAGVLSAYICSPPCTGSTYHVSGLALSSDFTPVMSAGLHARTCLGETKRTRVRRGPLGLVKDEPVRATAGTGADAICGTRAVTRNVPERSGAATEGRETRERSECRSDTTTSART